MGRAYSEGELIGFGFALEQATKARIAPQFTPTALGDPVVRERDHRAACDSDGGTASGRTADGSGSTARCRATDRLDSGSGGGGMARESARFGGAATVFAIASSDRARLHRSRAVAAQQLGDAPRDLIDQLRRDLRLTELGQRRLDVGGAPARMRQPRVDVGDGDIELALPLERFARRFTELRIFAWIDTQAWCEGARSLPEISARRSERFTPTAINITCAPGGSRRPTSQQSTRHSSAVSPTCPRTASVARRRLAAARQRRSGRHAE